MNGVRGPVKSLTSRGSASTSVTRDQQLLHNGDVLTGQGPDGRENGLERLVGEGP